MFSQTSEYALRAVLMLAAKSDTALTARDVAARTQTPVHYLSKVLQDLARAGVVRSQRGPRGGFTLARTPEQISMFDVIEAIEPLPRVRRCPLGIEGHEDLCPLHRRIDDALEMVEQSFRATSLAELLAAPGKAKPLCAPGETL